MRVRAEIGWFEIRVTDVNAALDFYQSVFDVRQAPWEEEAFTMLVDPAGVPRFALEKVAAPPPTDSYLRPTFDTEDLEQTLVRVEKAGGTVHQRRTEIGEGYGWWARASDPFGNYLAFSTSRPAAA